MKECLLIRLKGRAVFHIEGILAAMADGSMERYERLAKRQTLLNPKHGSHSHLYHSLGDMIKYAKEVDGWYENTWERTWDNNTVSKCAMDSLFKDEFDFLVAEGLLVYKEFEPLSEEDIIFNLSRVLEEDKPIGDEFKHSMLYLMKEIEIK